MEIEIVCSGFVEEGRIRKATWIEGQWRDIILMGILDEDWAARNQAWEQSQ